MTSTKIAVITDLKFDDFFALLALFIIYEQYHFDVIVSNIFNQKEAAEVLIAFAKEFSLIHNRNVSINVVYGHKADSPKSHEPMYAKIQCEREEVIPGHANSSYHQVYTLAPPSESGIQIMKSSENNNYFSIGYNSRKFTYNDFNSVPNLVTINNNASYQKCREGGRFKYTDPLLWDAVEKHSPMLVNQMRPLALDDSKEFIVRMLGRRGIYVHVKHIFDDELLDSVKAFHYDNPSDDYLTRVIDQLERKTLDVECTDFQHVIIWNNFDRVPSRLLDNADRVELYLDCDKDGIEVSSFKNIDKDAVWVNAVNFFA